MNKPEFIKLVAGKMQSTHKEAEVAVEAVIDTIGEVLQGGGEIGLVGFGTFSVSNRKSRTGKNPRTGEEIVIPATQTPHFKSGKKLKALVN